MGFQLAFVVLPYDLPQASYTQPQDDGTRSAILLMTTVLIPPVVSGRVPRFVFDTCDPHRQPSPRIRKFTVVGSILVSVCLDELHHVWFASDRKSHAFHMLLLTISWGLWEGTLTWK